MAPDAEDCQAQIKAAPGKQAANQNRARPDVTPKSTDSCRGIAIAMRNSGGEGLPGSTARAVSSAPVEPDHRLHMKRLGKKIEELHIENVIATLTQRRKVSRQRRRLA